MSYHKKLTLVIRHIGEGWTS